MRRSPKGSRVSLALEASKVPSGSLAAAARGIAASGAKRMLRRFMGIWWILAGVLVSGGLWEIRFDFALFHFFETQTGSFDGAAEAAFVTAEESEGVAGLGEFSKGKGGASSFV